MSTSAETMEDPIDIDLLFDEEAAEEAQAMEALAEIPVYRYIGTGESAPQSSVGMSQETGISFAEVSVAKGVIFAEPELGDLLLSPVISRELRCAICKDVLQDPHFTIPCGHVFCYGCIHENIIQGSRTCPICRTPLERPEPIAKARMINNLLSEVQIYCQNGVAYSEKDKNFVRTEGPSACPDILSLTDGPAHFKTCPFKLLKCPFHEAGCTDILERRHVEAHRVACEFRTVRCACGERVRVTASEEHAEICPAALIKCPHRHVGCTSDFQRSYTAIHLRTCPYELLKELLAEKDAKIEALTCEVEKVRAATKLQNLCGWGDLEWSGDMWARTCLCTPLARRDGA